MSRHTESYVFAWNDADLAASSVEAVATVTDRDPLALASLYDVVDAEALATLVDDGDDVTATFRYEGVSVTVTSGDEIRVAAPHSNDPLPEALADPSSVLVLEESRADDTCRALLAGNGHGRDLLGVTFAGSVHDRLAVWDPLGDDPVGNATVVSMGAVTRGAAAGDGTGPSLPLQIEAIEEPDDITALEVTIHERLTNWQTDAVTVACFHSITDLLDHVDERTASRFVDSLARRFAAAGATAHFHMDPSAHDAATIDRFRDCFDTVVTTHADGTQTVETD